MLTWPALPITSCTRNTVSPPLIHSSFKPFYNSLTCPMQPPSCKYLTIFRKPPYFHSPPFYRTLPNIDPHLTASPFLQQSLTRITIPLDLSRLKSTRQHRHWRSGAAATPSHRIPTPSTTRFRIQTSTCNRTKASRWRRHGETLPGRQA